MPKGQKRIPYVLVEWVNNKSEIYDGTQHWVPKTKMVESCPEVGGNITIKWYGRLWQGKLIDAREMTKAETTKILHTSKKVINKQTEKGDGHKKRTKRVKNIVQTNSETTLKTKKDSAKVIWIGSCSNKNDEKKTTPHKGKTSPPTKTGNTTPLRRKNTASTSSGGKNPKVKSGNVTPQQKKILASPNSGKKTSMSKQAVVKPHQGIQASTPNSGKNNSLVKSGKATPQQGKNRATPSSGKKASLSNPVHVVVKPHQSKQMNSPVKIYHTLQIKKKSPREKNGSECNSEQVGNTDDLFSPKKKKNVPESTASHSSLYEFHDSPDANNVFKQFTKVMGCANDQIPTVKISPRTSPMTGEEVFFYNNGTRARRSLFSPIYPEVGRDIDVHSEVDKEIDLYPEMGREIDVPSKLNGEIGAHPQLDREIDQEVYKAREESIESDIEEVLESRNFHCLGNAGPALMARNLVKKIFKQEEIEACYLRKSKRTEQLDPWRMEKIKNAVLREFQVPAHLGKAVWAECTTSIVQMLKYIRKNKSKAS